MLHKGHTTVPGTRFTSDLHGKVTAMYVAYLDETFEKNREHSVLGLVAPMDRVAKIEENLDRVVAKARRQHSAVPENAELHGYELSAGSGDWEALTTPRARVRIYSDAIRGSQKSKASRSAGEHLI